jgi:hypothetical protein
MNWTRSGLILLVCVAGCHDFLPLVADGRCGNGILEPGAGEDCDAFAAAEGTACGAPLTEQACRYVCSRDPGAAGDPAAPRCPGNWGCGEDGICRAPSGRFERPSIKALSGSELLVGDLDGDRRQDLVLISNTQLTVAYGDAEGRFESATTVPIAVPDSAATVVDLDEDGADDLVLPSVHGVHVFRGHPSRSTTPVAIPYVEAPMSEAPVRALPVRTDDDRARDDILVAAQTSAGLDLLVEGFTTEASAVTALLPGAAPLVSSLPVADLDPTTPGQEVALAREGDRQVQLVNVSCDPGQGACALEPWLSVPVAEQAPLASGGSFFGDVDGDGRVDLLVVLQLLEGLGLGVGLRGEDGSFAPIRLVPGLREAAGCYRCNALSDQAGLEAVVDLDGDGLADFVNRGGVLLSVPGDPPQVRAVASPARPWSEMAVADLNRDGLLDVVASRPSTVDIALASAPGRFNILSAPTEASPSFLVTGDFDGDLLPDIAVLEPPGTVAVLYSGRQGVPTERVVMAELNDGSGLAVARLGDDDIDDLLVTVPRAGLPTTFVRLTGDSSRRMASVIPRQGPVIQAAVAGRFRRGGGPDILISEPAAPMTGGGGGGAPVVQTRRVSLGPNLGNTPPDEATLTLAEGCQLPEGGFWLATAADLDGDGLDEYVVQQTWGPTLGDDGWSLRPYGLRVLRVEQDRVTCSGPGDLMTLTPPDALAVADVDGDGRKDVILALDAAGGNAGGRFAEGAASGVVVYHGDPDAPSGLAAPRIYPTRTAPETVLKIGLVQADADPQAELAFGTPVGIGVLDFDRQRGMTETVVQRAVVGEVRQLRGVDVDADGLEDLVIAARDSVVIYMHKPCGAAEAATTACHRDEPQ